MAVLSKMHMKNAMYGLFVLLALVLLLNPGAVKNMYGTILGRLLFLILVIFFTMHNSTLGLLLVLVVIVIAQMYSREGMEDKKDEKNNLTDSITGAISALKAKTIDAQPTSTPVNGAAAVLPKNDTTKKLTETLANLQDVIAKAKPTSKQPINPDTMKPNSGKADRLTTENALKPKEAFTMMGTTYKTHNPDVAAYSPSAAFSAF